MPPMTMNRPSRSGKLPVRFIILAVVDLLLIGGAVATVRAGGFKALLSRSDAGAAQPAATQPTATQPTAIAPPPTEAIELGQFLVNVESAGGLHYLRADLALEVEVLESKAGKKAKDEEKEKGGSKLPPAEELRARDVVVQVLSSARFESLRTAEGREKLKARLLEALSTALPQQKLRRILLVSFVMQ